MRVCVRMRLFKVDKKEIRTCLKKKKNKDAQNLNNEFVCVMASWRDTRIGIDVRSTPESENIPIAQKSLPTTQSGH